MSSVLLDPRTSPVIDLSDPKTLVPLVRACSQRDRSRGLTNNKGVFAIVALSAADAWHTALYHLRTSYLFIRSDIKTIILPVVRSLLARDTALHSCPVADCLRCRHRAGVVVL
jgi:hypothetical protein